MKKKRGLSLEIFEQNVDLPKITSFGRKYIFKSVFEELTLI
jgi:hypothetical protein